VTQLRRAPGESDLLRKAASFHEQAAALRSRRLGRSQLLGGHRAEGPRGFAGWQMPNTVAADHEHMVKSSLNTSLRPAIRLRTWPGSDFRQSQSWQSLHGNCKDPSVNLAR
jgi:hypothetical protein